MLKIETVNMMLFCCLQQIIHVSDEEVGDDDISFGDNLDLPVDAAGAVEIQGAESSDSETDDEIDEGKKTGLASYHFVS